VLLGPALAILDVDVEISRCCCLKKELNNRSRLRLRIQDGARIHENDDDDDSRVTSNEAGCTDKNATTRMAIGSARKKKRRLHITPTSPFASQ